MIHIAGRARGVDMPACPEALAIANEQLLLLQRVKARSTLRRDNPVASITVLIVVAPLSTARATFDIT